jgi:hypothetical protein
VFDGFNTLAYILGLRIYPGLEQISEGVLLTLLAIGVFKPDDEFQLVVDKFEGIVEVLEFEVAVGHELEGLEVVYLVGVGALAGEGLLDLVGLAQHLEGIIVAVYLEVAFA